ncbi:MAG: CopD family protein [Betaproteobacteria bacterium]
MLYRILLFVHLASVITWVGGMVFALFCLRPAAGALPPPQRIRLMQQAMGHFLSLVSAAVGLILLTGVTMIVLSGLKSLPVAWFVMIGTGVAMMAIFGHLRVAPYKRLGVFVDAQDWPAAAAQLNQIRVMVMVNLVLGFVIVAAMKIGV